jgi:hypothetical protein
MQFRGTRADLERSIRLIPSVLAGAHPDVLGIREVFFGYVANAVLREIRDAYLVKLDGGTGSDGIRWAELAVATLAKRRSKGRTDSEILLETGDLLASLRPGIGHHPLGNPEQVFDVKPGGVTVGTADRKADRHQTGTEFMPARPIVPPDGELPPAWIEPVERAMEEGIAKVIEMVVSNGGIN